LAACGGQKKSGRLKVHKGGSSSVVRSRSRVMVPRTTPTLHPGSSLIACVGYGRSGRALATTKQACLCIVVTGEPHIVGSISSIS
jgi:hypothetical protein